MKLSQADCIFCSIVSGGRPSYKVFEDRNHLAFLDIHPFVRGHTLVVPKEHYDTLLSMDEKRVGGLFECVSKVAVRVVKAVGADGFRLIQNNGEAAAQVVKHVHVHIIPLKLGEKEAYFKRLDLSDQELSSIASSIWLASGKKVTGLQAHASEAEGTSRVPRPCLRRIQAPRRLRSRAPRL